MENEQKKEELTIQSENVQIRKRSFIERMVPEGLGRRIFNDVIWPSFLKIVDTAITETKNAILYKDDPDYRYRDRYWSSEPSYTKYYKDRPKERYDDRQREYVDRRVVDLRDPRNLELKTRTYALDVMRDIRDIARRKGYVSVADLYSSAGATCDWTYQNYGWSRREVENCTIRQTMGDMFYISLPRATSLNN